MTSPEVRARRLGEKSPSIGLRSVAGLVARAVHRHLADSDRTDGVDRRFGRLWGHGIEQGVTHPQRMTAHATRCVAPLVRRDRSARAGWALAGPNVLPAGGQGAGDATELRI